MENAVIAVCAVVFVFLAIAWAVVCYSEWSKEHMVCRCCYKPIHRNGCYVTMIGGGFCLKCAGKLEGCATKEG